MAEAQQFHARETTTLKFARFIVRHRFPVAIFLVLSTAFFFYPTLNMIMTAFGRPLPGTRPRSR